MSDIDKVLDHFGIKEDDIGTALLSTMTNGEYYRIQSGVDFAYQCSKRNGDEIGKKVRIIIDYDTDYPVLVSRIIPQ